MSLAIRTFDRFMRQRRSLIAAARRIDPIVEIDRYLRSGRRLRFSDGSFILSYGSGRNHSVTAYERPR